MVTLLTFCAERHQVRMPRVHRHGDEKVRRTHCGHYRQRLLLNDLHSRRAAWQGLGVVGDDGAPRLIPVRPHVAFNRRPHVPLEKRYPGRGRKHVRGRGTPSVTVKNVERSRK